MLLAQLEDDEEEEEIVVVLVWLETGAPAAAYVLLDSTIWLAKVVNNNNPGNIKRTKSKRASFLISYCLVIAHRPDILYLLSYLTTIGIFR